MSEERVIGGAKTWPVDGEAAIGEEGQQGDEERDGKCVCVHARACVLGWGTLKLGYGSENQ